LFSFFVDNERFYMPVQVVTSTDAERLLKSLHSGVAAPSEWNPTGREETYIGIIPNKTSKEESNSFSLSPTVA
jgi:hypothetical protein